VSTEIETRIDVVHDTSGDCREAIMDSGHKTSAPRLVAGDTPQTCSYYVVADIESDMAIVAKKHETAKEDSTRAIAGGESSPIEQR
jgi:hypothetical protein